MTTSHHPANSRVAKVLAATVLLGASLSGCQNAAPETTEVASTTATTTAAPIIAATGTAPTPSVEPSLDVTVIEVAESEVFARSVAAWLFNWDTAVHSRQQVIDDLLSVGDPTGIDLNGLGSDVLVYLPDRPDWEAIAVYQTKQWIEIDTVTVPEKWQQVTTDTTNEEILPGTIAYTITGTRHREGTLDGEQIEYSAPISFTAFITCAPSFAECHLMRLSAPNNPLQ